MLFLIALIAVWVGCVVSFYAGRRGFPIVFLILSFLLFFLGDLGTVGLALLAIWVWVLNKKDGW